MSHRFKLLFVTCLAHASLPPDAVAGVSLRPNGWDGSDRTGKAMKIALEEAGTAIEPTMTTSLTTSFIAAASSADPAPHPSPPAAGLKDWVWWGTIGLLPIIVVSVVFYLLRPKAQKRKTGHQTGHHHSKAHSPRAVDPSQMAAEDNAQADTSPCIDRDLGTDTSTNAGVEEAGVDVDTGDADRNVGATTGIEGSELAGAPRGDRARPADQKKLPISVTTRLARLDIVEALIHDLHSSDLSRRRKAIWELGQRGDSRAIQPLVDLLVDSDSTQRGLILAATTEISIRALKPMHRALMLSMQDSSPEVRKNALRDITRVYELVTQTSQLLQYVTSDADAAVRETAEWALEQLNRTQPGLGAAGIPSLASSNSSPSRLASLAEKIPSEMIRPAPEGLEGSGTG